MSEGELATMKLAYLTVKELRFICEGIGRKATNKNYAQLVDATDKR